MNLLARAVLLGVAGLALASLFAAAALTNGEPPLISPPFVAGPTNLGLAPSSSASVVHLSPNSDVGTRGDEAWGSARRWRAIFGGPPEIPSNPFLRQRRPANVWNDGLDGPPKPAREPRALPTSEFGLNGKPGLSPPLKPGVYQTRPYAIILVVPETGLDDRCVVGPSGDISKMPNAKPDVQAVPKTFSR